MHMRNSPVARTPPKNLPVIPGVTLPGSPLSLDAGHKPSPTKRPVENGSVVSPAKPAVKPDGSGDEPQFAMDI